MKAWLIVNGFLKSSKFEEIYRFLIVAAGKRNIELLVVTNDMVLSNIDELIADRPEFVIFWDKDIAAAKILENKGLKVFNCSEAIKISDDKSLTYISLMNEDIRMPKTVISPLTFGMGMIDDSFIEQALKVTGLPAIIKENQGSFGAQVYKADDFEEAKAIIKQIGNKGFIIQEYISTSSGRDIRINMVEKKAVTAMLRLNENDFRANITNGGTMQKYTPTKEQVELAVKVCEVIGLDFAGVDIMFGTDDEPVFCEVNSNAHFKNIYDCTGVNVADEIIDYIISRI